eukprot:329041-Rhodomonas_salina.1
MDYWLSVCELKPLPLSPWTAASDSVNWAASDSVNWAPDSVNWAPDSVNWASDSVNWGAQHREHPRGAARGAAQQRPLPSGTP